MEPKSILMAPGAGIDPKFTELKDSKYSIQFVIPLLKVPKLNPIKESISLRSCP